MHIVSGMNNFAYYLFIQYHVYKSMIMGGNYSEQSLAEPQVTYENQGIMAFGSSCEARFN